MQFRRFALYYMPPSDAHWTRAASAWLGWDANTGTPLAQPGWPDLPGNAEEITRTPRKYGLHATIKPPFRLAGDSTETKLADACETLCARLAPVHLNGLSIERLGRFLALRPTGDETQLNRLAGAVVERLDPFRAPAGEAELTRRRASGLTPAQDANLIRWGYPYVKDQFRFHITLSGRLDPAATDAARACLETQLGPLLPAPFSIRELALVGEAVDGRFHLIHRYTLSGSSSDSTA